MSSLCIWSTRHSRSENNDIFCLDARARWNLIISGWTLVVWNVSSRIMLVSTSHAGALTWHNEFASRENDSSDPSFGCLPEEIGRTQSPPHRKMYIYGLRENLKNGFIPSSEIFSTWALSSLYDVTLVFVCFLDSTAGSYATYQHSTLHHVVRGCDTESLIGVDEGCK